MSFIPFSFHSQIQSNIDAAGYETPTPIQSQSIPAILQGRDLLGLAQTGTGKTAAFALPILQRLLDGLPSAAARQSQTGTGETGAKPRALILSPTRELAEQTCQSFGSLSARTGLHIMTIYGGVTVKSQIKLLRSCAIDIIVACPGRLLDLMQQRALSLDTIQILVLDEADQMCDMGFLPSIKKILAAVPASRQTLLFSATMPSEIRTLTRSFLRDPVRVEIGSSRPVETVSHAIYPVGQADKYELLSALLPELGEGQALIFTRTKHRAKKLALQLSRTGLSATALQGNLSQNQRQTAMDDFRSGRVRLMVATDIAARGIDISLISHVINFDMPDTTEAYTHRIGRTGRMMNKGTALTLVAPEDHAMLRSIEKAVGSPIERKTLEGFIPGRGEKTPFDARSPKVAAPRRASASNEAVKRRKMAAAVGMDPRSESRPDSRPKLATYSTSPSGQTGAHARANSGSARQSGPGLRPRRPGSLASGGAGRGTGRPRSGSQGRAAV